MNEFKALMYLLSRRGDAVGVDEDTLMDDLGIRGGDGGARLHALMDAFASYVSELGLKVEQNPLDGKWFLVHDDELASLAPLNPFPGRTRLASTLVAVLIASACQEDTPTIDDIKKVRNKKDITKDLKELEELGLLNTEGDRVLFTEKVGYYIDMLEFTKRLAAYLDRKENEG